MLLYFLRHAEAEDETVSDFDRKLTSKGLEQADKAGKFCVRYGLIPDVILSSPVVRAEQTARAVSKRLDDRELIVERWLACGMAPETFLEALAAYAKFEHVMLVGHEPDFSGAIAACIGLSDPDHLNIRKASLTAVDLPRLRAGTGRLRIHHPRAPHVIMKPDIIHSKDFVNDAVALIESAASEAIAARGTFSLALSGGNTPKPVFEMLAERPIDWSKVIITFGDERCVPPDDEQSNYLMARRTLLDAISIPPENVLRMKGEIEPATAAKEYETELLVRAGCGVFRHDLILLGMGPDGHTASLFPGTPALTEHERLVVENYVPKMGMWRITFTYPLLDAARHVCFLVNSAGKDDILDEVFSGKSNYPCAAVNPADGKLTWLLGA